MSSKPEFSTEPPKDSTPRPDTQNRLPIQPIVGEADRLPGPAAVNAPGGEGMLVGPRNPIFGQMPPQNPQGPVPPGARFDPIFTPIGPERPDTLNPNQVPMGPDNDLLPPPDVNPSFGGPPRPPPGQGSQGIRFPGHGFPQGGPFGGGGGGGFRF